MISLAFPKSRIKLGKQEYLIFWKSQGLLSSLQALSRGNTLFVKTWLCIAYGYDEVSQCEKWFSRLLVFHVLWSVLFTLSHYSSKYWYKNSLLLINPWLTKLKPANIPILFSGSTARFVAALRQAVRVDRKWLYTDIKGGIFFGGGLGPSHNK